MKQRNKHYNQKTILQKTRKIKEVITVKKKNNYEVL